MNFKLEFGLSCVTTFGLFRKVGPEFFHIILDLILHTFIHEFSFVRNGTTKQKPAM